MSTSVRILMATVLAALCVACGSADEVRLASCAAPFLDDRPPTGGSASSDPAESVNPGTSITVYGHGYTTTCNDTGQNEPEKPMPPVRLTLTLPGGVEKDLGTFKPAGGDMGFAAVVQIPLGTPPGVAEVRDDQEIPAKFTFEVGVSVPREVPAGLP